MRNRSCYCRHFYKEPVTGTASFQKAALSIQNNLQDLQRIVIELKHKHHNSFESFIEEGLEQTATQKIPPCGKRKKVRYIS